MKTDVSETWKFQFVKQSVNSFFSPRETIFLITPITSLNTAARG